MTGVPPGPASSRDGSCYGQSYDAVPATEKDELTSANAELRQVLGDADADADRLTEASEKVMQIFSRVGQAMHQQAQTTQPPRRS